MATLLALASALSYGFADFAGGSASRRAEPFAVTATSQGVGIMIAPVLLLLLPAPFSGPGLFIGIAAGVFGGLGLALYFTALRDGVMGVVSPLSAVSAAGVPIAVGMVSGERPAALALFGMALALPAIYLSARPSNVRLVRESGLPPGVVLGMLSGLAFGCFFALLDFAPADSGAWPLLGSKVGSLSLVVIVAAVRGQSLAIPRAVLPVVVASGALDMTANTLFLLATRDGLLSLVSVIAAQYPVVVVVLSLVFLRERLSRSQGLGVVLALVAVGLISVS